MGLKGPESDLTCHWLSRLLPGYDKEGWLPREPRAPSLCHQVLTHMDAQRESGLQTPDRASFRLTLPNFDSSTPSPASSPSSLLTLPGLSDKPFLFAGLPAWSNFRSFLTALTEETEQLRGIPPPPPQFFPIFIKSIHAGHCLEGTLDQEEKKIFAIVQITRHL